MPDGPADPLERIAWLTERNRARPDPATEEALVRARYDAFGAVVGSAERGMNGNVGREGPER